MKQRKSILYMPDGNRRYAHKEGISFAEAYKKGANTLELFTNFFLLEKDWTELILHIMSKYTHQRDDGSLEHIYDKLFNKFSQLYDEHYFEKNNLKFLWIDHSDCLPEKVVEICNTIQDKTKKGSKIVRNLLGYDLETDERNAFRVSRDYNNFCLNRLVPPINLVIRTTEMRPSGGPVYAMAQAQMMTLNKFNPEVTKEDLVRLLKNYHELKEYGKSSNPYHKSRG